MSLRSESKIGFGFLTDLGFTEDERSVDEFVPHAHISRIELVDMMSNSKEDSPVEEDQIL